MTLDEAIQHCIDIASKCENQRIYEHPRNLKQCAEELRQIAEWLKEYKMLKDDRKSKKQKYVYMLVSQDEYELPISMYDSVKEMAEDTGYTETNIRSTIHKYEKGVIKTAKFRRVKI